LGKQLAVLEQDIKNQKESLQNTAEQFEKAKAELEQERQILDELNAKRMELFEDKNPEIEREKFDQHLNESEEKQTISKERLDAVILQIKTSKATQKSQQKQLDKSDKSWKKINDSLIVKIAKIGLTSITDLSTNLLSESDSQRIQEQKESLQKRHIALQQSQKDLNQQLDKEKNKELTTESTEILTEQTIHTQTEYESLQQQIGGLNKQLEENDLRKQQSQGLIQQIEKQRKEFNRWAKLNELIGQADGQKFRKFAQGLTLQKLAQLANQQLQKLSGRYIIIKPDDKVLQLDIMDTFQADNIRSMNTLSGGESFLVSLALALGLSDMAGRRTNIRSLFIDEGFGTLDEQTLDMAITTLENLQASGKTIGVISHVRELKERISTQIQVFKKGNGMSEVAIV